MYGKADHECIALLAKPISPLYLHTNYPSISPNHVNKLKTKFKLSCSCLNEIDKFDYLVCDSFQN